MTAHETQFRLKSSCSFVSIKLWKGSRNRELDEIVGRDLAAAHNAFPVINLRRCCTVGAELHEDSAARPRKRTGLPSGFGMFMKVRTAGLWEFLNEWFDSRLDWKHSRGRRLFADDRRAGRAGALLH